MRYTAEIKTIILVLPDAAAAGETSIYQNSRPATMIKPASTPVTNRQSTQPRPTAEVQPMTVQQSSNGSFTLVDGELYGNMNQRPLSCIPVSDLHRYIQQEKAENPGKAFQKEYRVIMSVTCLLYTTFIFHAM